MISSGSQSMRAPHHLIRPIALSLALQLLPVSVSAQELTPGAYWPLPDRINILTFVNSANWGDVSFDPALPTEDARGTIDTVAIAYTRTWALDQHHALRASASRGAYTTIGGDFTSVAVGYNYAWTR